MLEAHGGHADDAARRNASLARGLLRAHAFVLFVRG